MFEGNEQIDYEYLVEGIRQATQIILYEGLPAWWNKVAFNRELALKETIQYSYGTFYKELLPLTEDDAEKLTHLCCDKTSFMLGWHSDCMFHADYCVEWLCGEDITRITVCFSCHDIHGQRGSRELITPMNGEARSQFEKILLPYRKNRPAEAK